MSPRAQSGFTLIELLAVLAIIAVVTAAVTPSFVQWVQHERQSRTLRTLQAAYLGIYGDPRRADHGFVGDMGQLPASLEDLVEPPLLPAQFLPGNLEGARFGWSGAYAQIDTLGVTNLAPADAWGNPIRLDAANGCVESNGPDGLPATADDLFVPDAAHCPLTGGSLGGALWVRVLAPARDDQPGALVPVAFDLDPLTGAVEPTVVVRAGQPQNGATPGLLVVDATIASGATTFIFAANQLTQGYHQLSVVGQPWSRLQELRGSAQVYVKAGSTRYVTITLASALADPTGNWP
jgi:prepilin-type N-terminal cleavage/methylation domain-containing protein